MIAAVVVSYNPERRAFTDLLRSLSAQVEWIFIVDNSPRENESVTRYLIESEVCPDRVSFARLGENLGIASALNIGIASALEEGADFVLLSDQDSRPAGDMVKKLMEAYEFLVSRGNRVGAIGPSFTDIHTGLTYPFQVALPGRLFYGHKAPTDDQPHVAALTLITSGTLIPRCVLQAVGGMREDFFIDFVDIEWCHRVRCNGYSIYGTGWARMYQQMGEACLRVWYLGWRNESAYPPLRLYYRLRNFVVLCGMRDVDWRWKIRASWYWLGIVYAHCVFGARRQESLRMCVKGIWHGLRGTTGRYLE